MGKVINKWPSIKASAGFSSASIKLVVCIFCIIISINAPVAAQVTHFDIPLDFLLTVAWSPDGTKLAVGGGAEGCNFDFETHAIYILDAHTGAVLRTLTGHTCQVNTLAWNPDSNLLVSGSDDSFAFVWNTSTGEQITGVQMPKDFLARAGQIWSPDGLKNADYYAGGKKAFIWDAQTGQVLKTFEFASMKSMSAIAWNHGGNRLAVGGWNVIYIVDTDTGVTQMTWPDQFGSITSLAWSPDDTLLASGSADRIVRLWDIETETVVKKLVGHTKSPLSLTWSPDGNKLASAGIDKTARIWDVATGDQTEIFTSERAISGAAWSPDNQFAYVDAGGILQIVIPNDARPLTQTIPPAVTPITDLQSVP